MYTTTKTKRGCGERKSGKIYLCTGHSPYGLPIENFIFDPVINLDIENWKKGYRLFSDGNNITHIIIYVGKKFYPNIFDFIEEVGNFGLSRRVNNNIDFTKLTPGKSMIYLAHSAVEPLFEWELYQKDNMCKNESEHTCTYNLKPLSLFFNKGEVLESGYKIERPSFNYYTNPLKFIKAENSYDFSAKNKESEVNKGELNFSPKIAIFMGLPLTHIEARDYLDPSITEKAHKAGYPVYVLDY